jgi:predicted transcriptional regulator
MWLTGNSHQTFSFRNNPRLSKHVQEFEPIANKTLEELGLASKSVVTIGTDDLAVEAFQKMVKEKVTSVAIVDSEGSLVTSISAKDIKVN